jgi:hypothetical protein
MLIRITPFMLLLMLSCAAYTEAGVRIRGLKSANEPITFDIDGPAASESGEVNPFRDYHLSVTFRHGDRTIDVPGYFAADGDAANTCADAGSVWRTHFVPDQPGEWTYRVRFRRGTDIAVGDADLGVAIEPDSASGSVTIAESTPSTTSLQHHGKLMHVGQRYLRFSGSKRYFLKSGCDSPENLLGYADFDNTHVRLLGNGKPSKRDGNLHRFDPHVADWREGDPTWGDGRGKGIVGGLNYLASKGVNSVYFLTMNVHGDGDDVWPWVSPTTRDRYDCSKLDQWSIVFDHMDRLGIALHVVTQETENDQLLNDGELGFERKLYYRELIARFGHHRAVVWNLGEENTNTAAQRKSFADYFKAIDPYDNPVVIHTYPNERDKVYRPLLGWPTLDGVSGQFDGGYQKIAPWIEDWLKQSSDAGKQWVISVDEIGPADRGIDPDGRADSNHPRIRREVLWGPLMSGSAGVEWYFGYKSPHNDVNCEDWRSRDSAWDMSRHAVRFFHEHLPFHEMTPARQLTRDGAFCLAKPGVIYAMYLPAGGEAILDLTGSEGVYEIGWYDPRRGGALQGKRTLRAGGWAQLGTPPSESDQDWAVLVRRVEALDASTAPAAGIAPATQPAELKPIAEERDGVVRVEAEAFARQRADTVRRWYVFGPGVAVANVSPDGDSSHADSASGGAYIECLPDTRRSHNDRLVHGENFSETPGKVAVLDYPIHFNTAGRYYVWVRAFCTGTEDNGIHVGLNETWPDSGRRLQWTSRDRWHWDSKQRTDKVHTGVAGQIWLDVPSAGTHTVSFSMREDGFEFDAFLLTQDPKHKPTETPVNDRAQR